MSIRFARVSCASFALSVSLAACGGDRFLLDSGVDVPADRVTTDTARDAGSDTTIDTGADATTTDVVMPMDVQSAVDATDTTMPMDVATDTGRDVAADTGRDATVDVPAVDVIVPADVVMVDAGPSGRCSPTIDGTIGADWNSSSIIATNTTATAWGPGLNEIRSVRVCYDATSLYLGINGVVETANAIVGYIDRDYDPPGGAPTGVSLFSALTDNTGTLDDAISAALVLGTGAGNFGAEAAWGTAGMSSVSATALDPAVGLRLIGPGPTGTDRRSDFAWTMGSQTACGSASCEVSIAWTSLFEGARPATGRIAMFFRLNNGDGSMSSNQTVPEDDPSMSRTVSRVLVVPYGP